MKKINEVPTSQKIVLFMQILLLFIPLLAFFNIGFFSDSERKEVIIQGLILSLSIFQNLFYIFEIYEIKIKGIIFSALWFILCYFSAYYLGLTLLYFWFPLFISIGTLIVYLRDDSKNN